jgi:hypothetical protein
MAESFSVSKDSIHIPYQRFLADSAAGFVLILILIAAYFWPLLSSEPLRQEFGPMSGGSEVKVFVLVVAFLLATPLGFTANALSWLLLGQLVAAVERQLCHRTLTRESWNFPVWYVTTSRQVSVVLKHFGAEGGTFHSTAWFLRESLEVPSLAALTPETHARGLVIFLRNTTMFMIIGALISLNNAHHSPKPVLSFAMFALLAFGLVSRWDIPSDSAKPAIRWMAFACLGSAACGIVWQYIVATDARLANQAVFLLAAALVLAIVVGVIGYYHYTLVFLHAYLVSLSVGGPDKPYANPLTAVADMVDRVRKGTTNANQPNDKRRRRNAS